MDRFTATIDGWTSWGRVFQSIEAFEPLIRHILSQHALPIAEIEHCTPGTNAVFKVGDLVVKIFAPKESGFETESDYQTELFGIARSNRMGVSALQPWPAAGWRTNMSFRIWSWSISQENPLIGGTAA